MINNKGYQPISQRLGQLVKSTYASVNDLFRGVIRKRDLAEHIATRERHIDWTYIMGYLPNPDPILKAIGQDITIYRDMLVDAHIGSCVDSRRSGVLSCEYKINPGGPGRKNQYAADMITDIVKNLEMERIIREIIEAELFGYSPIEIMWLRDARQWYISDLVGKPQEWFVFDEPYPEYPWDKGLRFLSNSDLVGEFLPARKFLVPRYGESYQNPYGLGVLSRCFWPAAFKKGGAKFWLVFAEKYGMPWVIGKVPPGTDSTKREDLLTKLNRMVQDAIAVISNDESIEIQGAEGKGASSDVYERMLNFQNREISKALVGHTLNTEVNEHGSNAALQGSLDIRQDIIDSSKTLVKKTMAEAFRHIVELNLTSGVLVPELAWFEEADVKKEQSERDKNLMQADPRFKPKAIYYQREYNFEEGDFELVEPDKPPVDMGNNGQEGQTAGTAGKESTITPSKEQQGDKENEDGSNGETGSRAKFSAQAIWPGTAINTPTGTPEQQEIDNLIEQAKAKNPMGDILARVQEILESSSSIEEAKERLLELYAANIARPEMAEPLADDMFQAGMFGRYTVSRKPGKS